MLAQLQNIMVKKLIVIPFILFVGGCASQVTPASKTAVFNGNDDVVKEARCKGYTQLPATLVGQFDAVIDSALLAKAIGKPGKGGLCKGKVYQAKVSETITVYRSWNSRNKRSKLGRWWAVVKARVVCL